MPNRHKIGRIGYKRGEDNMNSLELTAAITAAANLIASGLTNDELNLLGVILTQLSDTLFTISTQRSLLDPEKGGNMP